MTDWILTLTGLAIYIGSIIGIVFSGVRPEVRAIGQDKEDFRKTYQDKVSVLQGKAELSLIEAISNAEKLREIFGRPLGAAPAANPISAEERAKIDTEISSITARIKDVTEPKELFTRVLKDYDQMRQSLETFSGRAFILSLLIPLNAISYSVFSIQMANGIAEFSVFLAILSLLAIVPSWSAYSSASSRVDANRSKLADAVTQRIFLPPSGLSETPPASPGGP